MTKVHINYKVYQKFQLELPSITQNHQNIPKVSVIIPRKSCTVIKNGAPHQFVDGKVIQGNFADSQIPFRECSLQIHTSMKESLVKITQTWGTSQYCQ